MYRLSSKRRLLHCLVYVVPTTRPPRGHELAAHPTIPSCVRGVHSTPSQCSIFERMAGVSKFKYEIIRPDEDSSKKVTFADVGGQHEAKVELSEIVDFLRNRKKYVDLGAKIPSGALLTGPPGNGKTLLARAIAGEASVPFINTAGPQFIEKIGGLGPRRVRDLFKECRSLAPCILFLDEIDAFAKKRSGGGGAGQDIGGRGSQESDNTLNQLLVELDGINDRDEIFIVGATNRDDILDSAITRPGRLDRKIYIGDPTEMEREEIFGIHMKKLKLARALAFEGKKFSERLAACTPGYSGAQIANICNEAAIHAARIGGSDVKEKDFEIALERVIAGLERQHPTVTEEELLLSAHYIAGQALLSFLLPTLTPVLKLSIVSRLQSPLGFAQFAPRKDLLSSKEHLLDLLCRGLAGKAAQKLFFGVSTTQAEKDLKRISEVAYSMVADHGMGESAPNMSFQETRSQNMRKVNLWSNRLQAEMDQEVSNIVQQQYEKAFNIVQDNRELVSSLASELMKNRTLTEADIRDLMNKCEIRQTH